MRAAIRVAMGTHDVRESETDRRDRGRRPGGDDAHGLSSRHVESIQEIRRRPRPGLRVAGQLKVPSRGTEMAVPQQPLNRVDVDAGFEQMRRETVPQRILTLPMNRPPRSFTTVTIPSTANP